MEINDLKPKEIWKYFSIINSIPRASKKEQKISAFIEEFGKSLNLETYSDNVGNVLIKKSATKGFEAKKKITLQSHLDMVCQKNKDTTHDFDNQGIDMFVEDGWVQAKGTTLGADNGIGVAAIMAILSSDTLEHPALEALFTVDEETGMTGANNLEKNLLEGNYFLNLDSEEDNILTIGSAGGIDITATGNYKEISVPNGYKSYEISISGLRGGHSGMEIHLGYGNANQLLTRFLYSFLSLNSTSETHFYLSNFSGGKLRNAIPREAKALVAINNDKIEQFNKLFIQLKADISNEFNTLEPNLLIELTNNNTETKVIASEFSAKFIRCLMVAHNGVFKMTPGIERLVETSNNIAEVHIDKGNIEISCFARSSVESSKEWIANTLKATFELGGLNVLFNNSYPGWEPNPNSYLVRSLSKIYKNLFNQEAIIESCHAGLECGIIGKNYPNLEMISFGPTIQNAHSPGERVNIDSVNKFWNYLLTILKEL